MMDKQTEANGDIIAGLAEQSAQGYLIQAQDEEIRQLKAQRDQAVRACRLAVKAMDLRYEFRLVIPRIEAAITATEDE